MRTIWTADLVNEFSEFVRATTGEEVPAHELEKALTAASAHSAVLKEPAGTPPTQFDASALADADFVELPQGVNGTNCGNCKYQSQSVCQHDKLVGLTVAPDECCAYWDADGVERVWQGRVSTKRYVRKLSGPHEYATTQLNLADAVGGGEVAIAALLMLQRKLDPADVIELEDVLHVTIKYGLQTSDPEEARRPLRSIGRVNIKLGSLNVFRSEEHDVLYCEVGGDDIRYLNFIVAGAVPNADPYPAEYNPHVTLAYLRPGTADKYLGKSGAEESVLEFESASFYSSCGELTRISLVDPDAQPQPVVQVEVTVKAPHVCAMCGKPAARVVFDDDQPGMHEIHLCMQHADQMERGQITREKGKGTCRQGQTQARTGCTPANGGGGKKPAAQAKPKQPRVESRESYEARATDLHASYEEFVATVKKARQHIAKAPVPSQEAVRKAREELELAKQGGRHGGESRGGSAAVRRKQRENLFHLFSVGDYCPCHGCGMKLTVEGDPGTERLERGKVFVKRQGGGYQLPNLLPECFSCNRSRNDTLLRPENAS